MESNLILNIDYHITESDKANLPYQLRSLTEGVIENRLISNDDFYKVLFDKYISINDLCIAASLIRNAGK